MNACSTGEKLSLPMERRAAHDRAIGCLPARFPDPVMTDRRFKVSLYTQLNIIVLLDGGKEPRMTEISYI